MPRSTRESASASSSRKLEASTTDTMVSSSATSIRAAPSSRRKANVAATGIGSEMPLDSITRWSNRPVRASRSTSTSRSSRKVQQMHPLVISTNLSSGRENPAPSATSAASTLTSLMSLTITATRRPSVLPRTWLSIVVLPAPRNPNSTVTGSVGAVVGLVVIRS